jgi:hypothetical protein
MDLSGLSARWDAAVADLESVVVQAQQVDTAAAVTAALDAAADQVAAQTAALRAKVSGGG